MNTFKDYQWNYVTAFAFAFAGLLFLASKNVIWVAFFALSITFLTLGIDAQRKYKGQSKAVQPKEPIEKTDDTTPTKKI